MNSATASLADARHAFLFGSWFAALFGRRFVALFGRRFAALFGRRFVALFGRRFVALFGRRFKVRVQNLVTSFQPNPGGSPGQELQYGAYAIARFDNSF